MWLTAGYILLALVYPAAMLLGGWVLFCTERATTERWECLLTISNHSMTVAQRTKLTNAYEQVSFHDHVKACRWARNPWDLYDSELVEFLKLHGVT